MFWKPAGPVWSNGAAWVPPIALLTSPSSRPKRSTTAATRPSTCAWSRTSAPNAAAVPPASVIPATTCSASSPLCA
jgi:hypothetical protein